MKYVDCSAPVREYLCQADPVLGAHIQRIGELYRPMKDDLFTALCSSIISQLISKKSAATVYNRLTEKCGGAITPQALAGLTPEEIQKCGMSMRKADNLSRIAHSVLGGETDLEHLHTLSDPEIVRVLSALPGVTANPAGGQVFQEFMVDFRATGKSVAEIHQALLARNIFGGVDLGKVFPAYAGYALYCVSDTTTAADIDTLCAALHDILGGTGA